MRCPFCGKPDSQVKDSRPAEDGAVIRRRRICPGCGARFTTFERVQLREIVVVKRSGRRAAFDRDKLTRSIQIALRKRPVDTDAIDQMVSGIVRQLEASGETEIPAEEIGQMVMSALERVDQVGFIRYASVYMDFREGSDFGAFMANRRKTRPPQTTDLFGAPVPRRTPELDDDE
jgi:transcriptional repressor NrdR